MKCEEASIWIMKYFDRELNDIELGQLKQHLKGCTACSSEFEELSGILGVLEAENSMEPPVGFESQVMEKVKTLNMERIRRTEGLMIAMYAMSSMVLFGMAVLLVGYFQEISVFEVVGRLILFINYIFTVFHTLSASQAGGILYGVLITAFAVVIGYMGMIIFMDNTIGGTGNETDK